MDGEQEPVEEPVDDPAGEDLAELPEIPRAERREQAGLGPADLDDEAAGGERFVPL